MEIPPAAMTNELVVGKGWVYPKPVFGYFGYNSLKQGKGLSVWADAEIYAQGKMGRFGYRDYWRMPEGV